MTSDEKWDGYQKQMRKVEAAIEQLVAENPHIDDAEEMRRCFTVTHPNLWEDSKEALAMDYIVGIIDDERAKIAAVKKASKKGK